MRAVVDIGSNSIKFSLVNEQGQFLESKSWITRLGKNLTRNAGLLDEGSVGLTHQAIHEVSQILNNYSAFRLSVVATSALRDAKNPQLVADEVLKCLKVPLNIISGEEEARLSILGAKIAAKRAFPESTPEFVFVDVGGASTEVGFETMQSHVGFSFQAGAVRCHEGLGLEEYPCGDETWSRAQQNIASFFPPDGWSRVLPRLPKTFELIGIGGSLVLAAKLAGAIKVNDAAYRISKDQLEALNEKLRKMTLEQRLSLPGMQKGREDIVVAGILCLTHVMTSLNATLVHVTEWGLRHGVLFADDDG